MDMNFFAPYVGEKKEKQNKNLYIYSVGAFLSVFILGSLVWNTANIMLLNNKIKYYNNELNKPEVIEKIAKYDDLNNKGNILNSYDKSVTAILSSLKTREIVTSNLLDKLSASIPSEVTFKNITINNNEISIQAVSTTREAIAEVQHNLRELNNINDVYISGISGEEVYNFNIKCQLKEGN